MTEQWSFRATYGSGRTIVTKDSVVPPWISHKSIFGGLRPENAVVRRTGIECVRRSYSMAATNPVQQRLIDCLSLGGDEE